MDIEDVFNDIVLPEELEKFEKKYLAEIADNKLSHKTQFEYAWCLIRSNYSSDIKKGVMLLEDLGTRHPDGKRDYIYFLSFGHARLKNYTVALNFMRRFLAIEPNNQQAIALEQAIQKRMDRDSKTGMAVMGGAALVFGGLVTLGIALTKRS